VDVRRAGRRGDGGRHPAFDRTVLLALRQPGTLAPLGPPAVQDAARDITALGGVAVLAMMIGIVAGFLILDESAIWRCSCADRGGRVDRGTILKDIFQRPDPTWFRASRTSPERVSPARIP